MLCKHCIFCDFKNVDHSHRARDGKEPTRPALFRLLPDWQLFDVLLLDNAGWHTLPNLAVPDGLKLVYLPPYSPELQPAETLWTLVDEPVVNTFVTNLDRLIDIITERCSYLTTRQPEISSRTNFAWLLKNQAPV